MFEDVLAPELDGALGVAAEMDAGEEAVLVANGFGPHDPTAKSYVAGLDAGPSEMDPEKEMRSPPQFVARLELQAGNGGLLDDALAFRFW